jgi:hypothetical protein
LLLDGCKDAALMGMENGPFSFTLSLVTPSLTKSDIAMKKHIPVGNSGRVSREKKSLKVSRKKEEMALSCGAGSAGTQSENRPGKCATGYFKGNLRLANPLFRARQSLGDGRLSGEKCVADLRHAESAQGLEGERHLVLLEKDRVAADKNQAQTIIFYGSSKTWVSRGSRGRV